MASLALASLIWRGYARYGFARLGEIRNDVADKAAQGIARPALPARIAACKGQADKGDLVSQGLECKGLTGHRWQRMTWRSVSTN